LGGDYVILGTATSVEGIEKALAKLPRNELARFRAWFDEFEAAQFDNKIAQDATA
jgi:hypothetical protein